MDFRFAHIGDADALTALINQAFLLESFFLEGDRITLEEVVERMTKGCFVVVDEPGGIAACVYLELRGDRSYLGLLAVDPARQKHGLASALMKEAESRLEAAGAAYVDITVVDLRTELPPIYRRRGYVETGTEPFPPDRATKQPCHLIVMTKEL